MPKYNVMPAKLPGIFFDVSVTYVNHRSASSVARTHSLSSLQQALNQPKPELLPQCLGLIFFLSQSHFSFAKAKVKVTPMNHIKDLLWVSGQFLSVHTLAYDGLIYNKKGKSSLQL